MLPVTKTEAEIINYLYSHRDRTPYAAEMVKDLKAPKRTVYRSLDSLEEKGIIEKELRGRMKFYKLVDQWIDVVEAAKIPIAETDETQSMAPMEREKIERKEIAHTESVERLETIRELENLMPFAEKAFGGPATERLNEALKIMKKHVEK